MAKDVRGKPLLSRPGKAPEGPFGFATSCGACGTEGLMEVVSGTFFAKGVALCSDGFDFRSAREIHTEGETAECRACGHLQRLDGTPAGEA